MLSLAEQFIAAMPDRIKNESEPMETSGPPPSSLSVMMPPPPSLEDMNSVSDDLGIESMCGDGDFDLLDFSSADLGCHPFDDAIFSYRDSASLSPASCSSYLGGPGQFGVPPLPPPPPPQSCSPSAASSPFVEVEDEDPPRDAAVVGSPRGTAADLQEFLQSKCEQDLSNLTLSDQEQRELYEAAQIIQKAYRSYKGRKKEPDDPPGGAILTSAAIGCGPDEDVPEMDGFHQEREAKAAVVIQNYYRRYKQYLHWKRVQSKAATVIQTKYREHKRFKKSQEAATCIQTYYRTYKEQQCGGGGGTSNPGRGSRESTPGGAGVK